MCAIIGEGISKVRDDDMAFKLNFEGLRAV